MRIGIITDGQAERDAIKHLFPKLQEAGQIVGVLYADLQPKAAPGQIARKAVSRVHMLRRRNADCIILLIDREDHPDCPPELAGRLEPALARLVESDVRVVVKDRSLENWLIADPDCLAAQPGRFEPTPAFRRRVSPNKADAVADAASLLSGICIKTSYQKGQDPARILKGLSVSAAARNSRSFRRFLRLTGDSRYRGQSKRP